MDQVRAELEAASSDVESSEDGENDEPLHESPAAVDRFNRASISFSSVDSPTPIQNGRISLNSVSRSDLTFSPIGSRQSPVPAMTPINTIDV